MAHGSPDYSVSTLAGFMSGVAQPQFNAYNGDAITWNTGRVVIWDNSAVQQVKSCLSVGDRRVCAVVAGDAIAPGGFAPLFYHGVCLVNVIGTGSNGDALITSATSGSAQGGVGGAKKDGFVGFALQSWGGPGQILAFVCPDNFRFNASVVIEGVLGISGSAPAGNLQCGNNPNRAVVCWYIGASAGGGAGDPLTHPLVNGVSMTTQIAYNGGFGAETIQRNGLFTITNNPTGIVGVSCPDLNGGSGYTTVGIFIALSGVSSFGTAVAKELNSAAVSVATTDAVPGDLVLGFMGYMSSAVYVVPLVTSHGVGQTPQSVKENAVRTFFTSACDSKDAAGAGETISFGLDHACAWCAGVIPVRPI